MKADLHFSRLAFVIIATSAVTFQGGGQTRRLSRRCSEPCISFFCAPAHPIKHRPGTARPFRRLVTEVRTQEPAQVLTRVQARNVPPVRHFQFHLRLTPRRSPPSRTSRDI